MRGTRTKKFWRFLAGAVVAFTVSVAMEGSICHAETSGYRQEAVALAASQVGYHEKETNENLYDFTANSGSNDWNKYADELWVKNGVPWGACFFWWVMVQTCVPKEAYPQSMAVTRTWFEERGMWREKTEYTPQPGDYILLNNVNKCGIVESVSEDSVTYIAGNVENSVVRQTRPFLDSTIDGYGLIDYDYCKPPEGLDLGECFLAKMMVENTTKSITNNGEDVVLWDDENTLQQKWLFTRQSDGTYTLRSLYDGMLLTVEEAGTKNNTNVYTAPDDEGVQSSQKWYILKLYGGYRLVPQHVPHFALDRVNYYDYRNGISLKIFCASESATQFFPFNMLDYYALENIRIAGMPDMQPGESQTLNISFTPEQASADRVLWESSNPMIAEVDENGVVTAKTEGEVTISVTSTFNSDISDHITIHIENEHSGKGETTEASTEKQTEKNSEAEKTTEKSTEKTTEVSKSTEAKNDVKIGSRIKDKYCYYEVTSTKKKTVKAVAIRNKKRTVLIIPGRVKYAGKYYKITAVGKNAFKNNKKLKTVTIGDNVKTIGENAFYGCKKLNKITLGKNVTSINRKAFYGCRKLRQIKIRSIKLKKIGKGAFQKISKSPIVYAPKKKIKKYKRLFKGKF